MERTKINGYGSVFTVPVAALQIIPRGCVVTMDGYLYNGTTHIKVCGVAVEDTPIGGHIPYALSGRLVGVTGQAILLGEELGCDDIGRIVPIADRVGKFKPGIAVEAEPGTNKECLFDFHMDWIQP